MQISPYLSFNGQCEAAFKFYERCLGGKILMMMTYGDSPMAEQTPPDWRQRILHGTLALGEWISQGADAPPEHYKKPQGFAVTIGVGDAAEADRIFKGLAENGVVQIPLRETFWALPFGMLVDQFGTPWMINCGNPHMMTASTFGR